jgi:hypothetical protein
MNSVTIIHIGTIRTAVDMTKRQTTECPLNKPDKVRTSPSSLFSVHHLAWVVGWNAHSDDAHECFCVSQSQFKPTSSASSAIIAG